MDRIKKNIAPFDEVGAVLKVKFSSAYISSQIDIMLKMQTENPTEAIGKAKEFIESCSGIHTSGEKKPAGFETTHSVL